MASDGSRERQGPIETTFWVPLIEDDFFMIFWTEEKEPRN